MIHASPASANPTYDPAYTVTARVLHWLVAALVLFQIPAGVIIANVILAWKYIHDRTGLKAEAARLPAVDPRGKQ